MRGITPGTQPRVIDHCAYASLQRRLAANGSKLIRSILTIDGDGQSVIRQLLRGTRHRAQREGGDHRTHEAALQDCKLLSRSFDCTPWNCQLSDQTPCVRHEFAPSSA